jgi:hypothetical protein
MSASHLCDGHGLDLASVAYMWTPTEIDEGATLVHGGRVRVNLLIQDPHLTINQSCKLYHQLLRLMVKLNKIPV